MLDPRFVVAETATVKDSLQRRSADETAFAAVDRLIELTESRASLVTDRDGLRAQRNEKSKAIGGLFREGRRDEAEAMKAEVTKVNDGIAALEDKLGELEREVRALALGIPNVLDADVPTGADESANQVVSTWGKPRSFEFDPQGHVEIGEGLGILDMERGAKLTGARFSVLHGLGARLERALASFFLDVHTSEHGYSEVMVPYMVHDRICEGTGQLPKFAADMFRIEGTVNGSATYLIPTAEVPVTNLHREEILDVAELPKKYACFTPCFRSEAGSAGRDVRGLVRVHQFHKVELVWVTEDDASSAAHEQLTADAEVILQKLELPYRKVLLASGDTSANAARCYDLEVWFPSQNTYREVSSCSNFRDYQARRMNARFRPAPAGKGKAKPRFVHTLNGSGLPIGRTMVAILENYQRKDGSVEIPAVLRPYMGVDEIPVLDRS